MKWETGENSFKQLHIGKWKVGYAGYEGCCGVGSTDKYKAQTCLPGLKEYLGHFPTEEAAKARLVQVAQYWLKNAGLVEIENNLQLTAINENNS